MDKKVEELIEALEKVNQLMSEENLKNATTEQLIEYNEQITRLRALLLEGLK